MASLLRAEAPEYYPRFRTVTQIQFIKMDSVLNPEAPEFYPHLTTVTQGGYGSMQRSTKSSNTFPIGPNYNLFTTLTTFNDVTSVISDNVIYQSNQIVEKESPKQQFLRNDHENNMEKLVDRNDIFLDRINVNLDKSNGVNNGSGDVFSGYSRKRNISSWNYSPVVTKVQMGSSTLIGAKNIPRPQMNFKDAVDNSDNIWVPKITVKHNSIKPLAFTMLYDEKGEPIGYEHPYKIELDLYHPPAHYFNADTAEPIFPAPLEETDYTYIDTELKLDSLVTHLGTVKEIAVDLEHHYYRSYQGITCLIQISTDEGGDYIIDALAVREHIHKLNLAFSDPKILKVFHGAESDILWLQRDFGVYVVGMFDTHQAAKLLQLPGLSLKHQLIRYCNVDTEKKYQLADWRMRPLPDELVQYARLDTHYLLYIWRQMRAELLSSAMHMLSAAFTESTNVCKATYNKEVITDDSHMKLYYRSKKSFNTQQMAALKMLYKWRDAQARMLDESTRYLLPNHMLLSLAETLPRELQGILASCNPTPPFVKQNLVTVHRMILSCRELPNEPQLYQMPSSIRNMVNAHQLHTYNVHDDAQYDASENYGESLDQVFDLAEEYYNYCGPITAPYLQIVSFDDDNKGYQTIVSDLNAEAKQFIPPFDRYRKYRCLAQIEEIKEFKEKEAKIAAIGKGNELIKSEVLVKLQQAKNQIENTEKKNVQAEVVEIEDNDSNKKALRKRKISAEKVEIKEPAETSIEVKKTEEVETTTKEICNNEKAFVYKNVNYKKFYNDTNKDRKQNKLKFKKYKK